MKLFKAFIDWVLSWRRSSVTFRHQETESEAVKVAEEAAKYSDSKYIICNNERIKIEWDKVVTHKDLNGLVLPDGCYKKVNVARVPSMFVVHWDVCLSSQSCFKVLKNRGLSVHFCIDNDGTIYQLMDCNDIGYHAGNWKVNTQSVGVEISNAYYLRYQSTYKLKGLAARPVLRDSYVHGRTLDPHLGFYPIQITAFKKLAEALHIAYNIPLESPVTTTVSKDVVGGRYKGVVNHYHITKKKTDCAGSDWNKVLKEEKLLED
tara:strand:+ start:2082 stop:2867 length:786 start_codon:yes stop_codon:yes gene_type:complete